MKGLGDLSRLMKQAQELQENIAEKQALLAKQEVTGSSGGGMVTVVATGDQQIKSIRFEPEIIDPEDLEMLQDLTVAAVNDALGKSKEMVQQEISGLAGGLNLPGIV